MATAKSEKQEIKKMGGKPHKNSGRGLYQKGDASLSGFTVDVKEFSKTFGLSKSVWSKVCSDAQKNNSEPALMVALGEGRETVRLWVISDSMFKSMVEAWEEKWKA